MIERTQSYKCSDGTIVATLAEAQETELTILFNESFSDGSMSVACAKAVLKNAPAVLDILTTTPTSKPKARKVNGGTKKRTPKTEPETPQA